MKRLVSRSELARIAGCSAMAVTKRCRGSLSEACEGIRVDVDHPSVVAWLSERGKSPPERLPTEAAEAGEYDDIALRRGRPPKRDTRRPSAGEEGEPGDISEYADLTLRELTDRFGTVVQFKDWLDARKKIADTRDKELRNEETAGHLIERELVSTHVLGAIAQAFRDLLTDAPKTIARRVYANAKAKVPVEESERLVRELIEPNLVRMKTTAAKVIRDA